MLSSSVSFIGFDTHLFHIDNGVGYKAQGGNRKACWKVAWKNYEIKLVHQ